MALYSKESFSEFQANINEVTALLKEDISKNNYSLHKLCLPARLSVPQFRNAYFGIAGDYFKTFDEWIPTESNLGGRDLLGKIVTDSQVSEDLEKFFPNFEGMFQVYSIVRRFTRDGGKLFSLTPQLIERLLDCAPPSDKVNASMLQIPFNNIFLEFGNNEHREKSNITANYLALGEGLVEGLYISEHTGTAMMNSNEMIEHFGLSRDDKYRVIEVGISFSPLSYIEKTNGQAAIEPLLNFVQLCIPDDEMPLNEVLELNKQLLKESLPDEIFKLMYNAILYLNLGARVQKTFSMPKELIMRMNTASNPNKRKRAALAASKEYAHIQIGSTSKYRVISDVNNSLKSKGEKGKKSPHARRGYFGIRYPLNEDGHKTPQLTWIKNSIIHRELLSSDEIELLERQYDVI
ncbi:hypothetical protein [Vibrio sp. D431a]|uniref:hypothetical protein n=1 Tax=Vibrio sp. D431a TaxID=2837388 RepID=UPI0025549DDE|nr:hypothetical protein [Vibrio sp. D431a]